MTFKEYITSFFSGLRSLLVGMGTTIKVFFRRKTTEQYPENRATLKISDRFRGELVMIHNDKNEHRCVACGICQMNCPNGTINVVTKQVTDEETGRPARYSTVTNTIWAAASSASCACVPARTMRLSSSILTSTPSSRAANCASSSITKVQLLQKNRRLWNLHHNR